jgi:hypothetical protein
LEVTVVYCGDSTILYRTGRIVGSLCCSQAALTLKLLGVYVVALYLDPEWVNVAAQPSGRHGPFPEFISDIPERDFITEDAYGRLLAAAV